MTICLQNHSWKYETEGVVKLFFPAEHFDFQFQGAPAPDGDPAAGREGPYPAEPLQGDRVLTRIKKGRRFTWLYAAAFLDGKRVRRASRCETSRKDWASFCERELCGLLFVCLERLTGIRPAWGTLTGVRPVKLFHNLLDQGLSPEKAKDSLRTRFLVSEEKLELAQITARVQRPILHPPERTFSLYVSIPFCPTRCRYCSFVSQSVEQSLRLIPDYVEKLQEELRLIAETARRLGLILDTVYFGGGTPTSLTAEQIKALMETISKSFNLSALREYTVEAGRPDTITPEKLAVLKAGGCTRISINPQTLEDSVLEAIGRRHTAGQALEAFALAREMGFSCINMDLIAGLPADSLEGFTRTMDGILALHPENVTVHTLSLKRSSALYQEHTLPPPGEAEAMVSLARARLTAEGYQPYYLYRQRNMAGNQENTGYALPGRENLYNIFMMEEVQTVLAAGAAASTKLVRPPRLPGEEAYIQRVYNFKYPYEYLSRFSVLIERKRAIERFYFQDEKHPPE